MQNELDEESLKRVKAKLDSDAANGVSQQADTDDVALIPGGVDVAASITANVWEVHVKVRGFSTQGFGTQGFSTQGSKGLETFGT